MPRRYPPDHRQTQNREHLRVIAALPREGRVQRQTRRAFVAHDGRPLTMTELRQWCFAGKQRQHWHYWSITRALNRLKQSRSAALEGQEFGRLVANPLPNLAI